MTNEIALIFGLCFAVGCFFIGQGLGVVGKSISDLGEHIEEGLRTLGSYLGPHGSGDPK